MVNHLILDLYRPFIDEYSDCLSLFDGKTILITGASGLIGSGFADFFFSLKEYNVIRNLSLYLQSRSQSRLEVRFPEGEKINGIHFIESGLMELSVEAGEYDIVIHAASPASPKYYIDLPIETFDANVTFTHRALKNNLCRQDQFQFLFISSADVYGDPDASNIPTKESYSGSVNLYGDRASYAESKRLAETLITSFRRKYGTRACIVRPFNIFGPGQRLDDGRLMADFLSKGLSGMPISLFSDGSPRRAFCYISDCIENSMRVLIKNSGEIYNVGNPENDRSIKEMAIACSEIMSLKEPEFQPPPKFQKSALSRCLPCIEKGQQDLGFVNRVGFEEGFRHLWKISQQ